MIPRPQFIKAWESLNTGNVEISLFDEDGTVRVGYVEQKFMYGKGEASKQMRRLCALADKAGVTLSLHVDPGSRPNPPMSKIELLKWYKRLGFESTPGRIFYMERKPMIKLNAARRLKATTVDPYIRRAMNKLSDALEDDGVEVFEATGPDGKYLEVEISEKDLKSILRNTRYTPVGLPTEKTYVQKNVGHNILLRCRSAQGRVQIFLEVRDD